MCEAEGLGIRGPDRPRDTGWIYEPDRQRALLAAFWGKLEPRKSLVFYYCNQGNPLDERATRVVVGVGRLLELGPQLYFGTKGQYQDKYPVWSRRVTQDYPAQGVRIPYQEYLRAGDSTEAILCRVPEGAIAYLSYVGEHVSDDMAVAVLERVIQSTERVNEDGLVPGDWPTSLAWLNDVLAEVWSGRGPFPGLGSVLQFLGCEKGTAFQRFVLGPIAKAGQNPWEYTLSLLEGRAEPEQDTYAAGLLRARERWAQLPGRQPLLATLARFELTPDQTERVANPDLRGQSGIHATDDELVANPYLVAELDRGTARSARIALETIDHGMRPTGDAALFLAGDPVVQDDQRRVRAVARSVLRDAAGDGDTLLPLGELIDRVTHRFPDRRACRPDRDLFVAEASFYNECLWTSLDSDPQLTALKELRDVEQRIEAVIRRRAPKTNEEAKGGIDWRGPLEQLFGTPHADREHSALAEKEAALATLFRHRLSVLTGSAGTGKTSVLDVFLRELERVEGRNPVLLLAPTGKARVRLSTRTHRNASTIRQFLLRQGWLYPHNFELRASSDVQPHKATTVVVDECSMIPSDLFGTLLKALDMGPLTRLVLVGDPNQLPPIGAGRPFVDILEWLKDEHPECIASLATCMRTDESDGGSLGESVGLSLADGYRTDSVHPGDDDVLSAVARGESVGDLEVAFWMDHDDLLAKLKAGMSKHLGIPDGDYGAFNRSLGFESKDWEQCEAWQILSPTRTQFFGTDDLNRLIQLEYKAGLIRSGKNPRSKIPRPFGELEIVWTDKVIQVVNRSAQAWPRDGGLNYVANGEIGLVENCSKGKGDDYLDARFSTQPDVSYRYFRNQVTENLELAYALTVHKAQGSDFNLVFLVIPQKATNLSRELIYTALTRFRRRLVLLIERDTEPLLRLRNPDCSETARRNTLVFNLALRPEYFPRPHLEALIHRTRRGIAVRSKSEVVVADILDALGISYEYEKPLYSKTDEHDFRLPDFAASFEGDVYYWEHLGMLQVPSYRERWERKLAWYRDNGYEDRLITSEDSADGGIDAAQIERIARARILAE